MDKLFKTVSMKAVDEVEGKVEAVFSNFNEVDSDGDVVLPNAIKSGYGDRGVAMVWAHDWKRVIGRGEIVDDGTKAIFKGQFIMDTQEGKDAYNTVKAMGDLQQWSFGYEVLDSEKGMFKKDSDTEIEVRYLNDVKVWEVSPVLVGANQNTYTMAVKQDKPKGKKFSEEVEDVLTTLTSLVKRARELTALRLSKEKTLSEESTLLISDLQDALQEAHQDIDTLLSVAAPEEAEVETIEDDTELLLETERGLMETFDPEL